MKHAAFACARVIYNGLYQLFCLMFTRRNEVLFASRQSNSPSKDFKILAERFEAGGWKPVTITRTFKAKHAIAYGASTIRQLYHLARCRACIVDGYNPAVSLVNMRCESATNPHGGGVGESASRGSEHGVPAAPSAPIHGEFPEHPLVMQIWHAYGAYKKFGYQAIGTREGRSLAAARAVRMHRNYSWILCSGECNREVFAQAFSYPVERVIALGRPSFDEHDELRRQEAQDAAIRHAEGTRPVVLFAPTLRRSDQSRHPFVDLCDASEAGALSGIDAELRWSFHPIENRGHAGPSGIASLMGIDIVVTDYSSIMYEAALLDKMVVFYLPDIDDYLESPGLNFDPLEVAPEISCASQDELEAMIERLVANPRSYDRAALDRLVGDTFEHPETSTTEEIFAFIAKHA
ncbi:CDP-glycerol glycerophosphotransferase family protein [Slackia exigua]|uniref:CDP-glycerol glycerophosphotransferase family protein n=1 Tax=Slackia exigua TaxID=84109 RepID=UPI003BA1F0C0